MKIICKFFRLDIVAAILSFLSLLSLYMTIMVPTGSSEMGSAATALTGVHLWEFTSIGFVLMVAPCVIMIMSKLHTKIRNKHLILFAILMLALIGYNDGIIVGSEWIRSMTGGLVHYKRAMVVYPGLLLMSAGILVVHMDFADFCDEYEEELAKYYEPEDEYYNFSR